MAKGEKQKQKLFRLLEIFMKETDEAHGLSMKDIQSRLEDFGISAERKSLYDDIITLGEMGFAIDILPTKPPRYTLRERLFEMSELKVLVDAVESSRFITGETSRKIIEKLRLFAGRYHSGELSRSVYVEDRVKTANDSTLANIDLIHKAINSGNKLVFKYFDYNKEKKKTFRHDGRPYTVSPAALLWSEEKYYLVALDEDADRIKNFRVDKMEDLVIHDSKRSEEVLSHNFNPAEYSRKIFGMYGGEEELVTLECRERLSGAVIDRFGTEPTFFSTDFGFRFSARVMVSPTFYSWVLSFGKDMRIVAPDRVREGLISTLDEVRKAYVDEA